MLVGGNNLKWGNSQSSSTQIGIESEPSNWYPSIQVSMTVLKNQLPMRIQTRLDTMFIEFDNLDHF